MADADDSTLAGRLRSATWPLHRQVESTPFVRALLCGALGRRAYALMLRSLYDVYVALESGLDTHARHPAVAPILDPALQRREALARDLVVLHGAHWAHELATTPAASAMAERLATLAVYRPAGLVSHAYVRYLGDLNGGQVLRRVVADSMALADGEGTSFYDFGPDRLAAALAKAFRAGLDRVPGTPAELDAIVDEAVESFRLHDRLFADLAAAAVQASPDRLRMRP